MRTYSIKLSQNPWMSAVVKAHATGDPAALRAKYDAESDPAVRATLAGEIRADVKFSTVGTYRLATMDGPTLTAWLSESDPAIYESTFSASTATTAKGTAKSAKSSVTPKLDAYAEFNSALRNRAISAGAVTLNSDALTGTFRTLFDAVESDAKVSDAHKDAARASILDAARRVDVRTVMLAEFSRGILIWPNADRGVTVARKLSAAESASLAADSIVSGMTFDDMVVPVPESIVPESIVPESIVPEESVKVPTVKVPTLK